MAKQVLRDNRQNLALWDGYARIERQRGRIDEARAVYVTTLSTYRTFDTRDQIDGPLLWRAWAEMEWEEGDSVLALKVLVAGTTSSETDLGDLSIFSLPAFCPLTSLSCLNGSHSCPAARSETLWNPSSQSSSSKVSAQLRLVIR